MPSSFRWPFIALDENVAIIGPKGSGKTDLLKTLLVTRKNVLAIDTKRSEDWSKVGTVLSEPADVYRIRSGRYAWRAPKSFLVEEEEQSALFDALLEARGPRITALDELFNYRDTKGLELYTKQGRAKRNSLWVAMQRPFGIPLYTLSEADHFFIFSLLLDRDRDRIKEVVGGKAIPWDELERVDHGFVHYSPGGKVSPVARLPRPF